VGSAINEKEIFKGILNSLSLFGRRRKVQVTKFAFEDFIFAVGSAANSVSKTLDFTAYGSGPVAKPSRANAFCFFFCPQPWFLRRSEHIFPGKMPVFIVTQ